MKVTMETFFFIKGIYSSDVEQITRIASKLEVGTVLGNRCDYLDPQLAFSGRKMSGNQSIGLSELSFRSFVNTKSLHVKLV